MANSKSKWLLAGLLTGAVAFGTACKSDSGAERGGGDTTTTQPAGTGTDTGTGTGGDTGTTPGTGGAGEDSYQWPTEDSMREGEPGVHGGTGSGSDVGETDDGTGGAGTGDDSVIIEDEGVDPGPSGGTGGNGPVLDEGVMDEDMDTGAGTGGSGMGGSHDHDDTGGSGTGDTGLNEGGNTTEPLPDDTDMSPNNTRPNDF